MEVSNYRRTIIELYSSTQTRYFKYMNDKHQLGFIRNNKSGQLLQYSGWKVILQILAMMYLVNMSAEQLDVYLERSYILFNEYVEKIYTTDFGEMHNPTMFVHKVLIGNIALNAYDSTNKNTNNESTNFITKLSKWSELILAWYNKKISQDERLYLNNTFTSSILNLVLDEKYYHTFRIVETLQDMFDHALYSERHSLLLTSLHSFLTKNNSLDFTPSDIQDIMFRKFFRDRETLEQKFIQSTSMPHMDSFIEWIFTDA